MGPVRLIYCSMANKQAPTVSNADNIIILQLLYYKPVDWKALHTDKQRS